MKLARMSCHAILAMALTTGQIGFSNTPTPGGSLVFGRGGDSVSLDPAAATDGESFNVTAHIYNTLVTFKPGTTDIVPDLAKSWDVSKDGLTYTFKLQEGVKFHDGETLDAEAVVFSFMRQKDTKHPAYAYSGPYVNFASLGFPDLIKSIEAVDKATVKFTLAQPNATFLASLGIPSFAIVSPKAVLEKKKDFRRNPVGSGPFVFQKWKEKEAIILKANPAYWGPKPHLESVVFRSIPDNTSRMMELMAQKIHVMDNPSPSDLETIQKRLGTGVSFVKQPGFNVSYLSMNNLKKPFDNVKVRQAISHAVNKEAIVKAVFRNYGKVAKTPMPPTLWGYNDNVEDYSYDLKKAKDLLTEAGYPNGFETTLWAMPVSRPYMPDGRKVAEAIQGDLAKIGVKAKIMSYDWGTYLDKVQAGEHDMALLGWTGDIGDPDNFLYVLMDKDNTTKPAQNISFYRSDELHEVLIAARKASDQNTRAELYKKAQIIIHKDAPLVPIAHSIEVVPTLSKIQGFTMDPTGRRNFSASWIQK